MSDMLQTRARRRRNFTRAVIALAVLAGGGLAANHFLRGEPAPDYRTATVTRGDIESAIVALGTVEPKNFVEVGAQASGQLHRIHAEIGDFVEQGQLLAEIDPTLAQARVDGSRAQLRELEASHRQQSAQLALARARAERSRSLRAADAISQAEFEADEAQFAVAEAQLAQLEAQIERTRYTLDSDLATLGYTNIYAPMAGTVIAHSASEGQTLNATQTAPPVMTIADLSIMTISADVSEADVPRLRQGLPAYFNTLGNPDRRWTATVRQILPSPEIVNDVVLYKALLDVRNDDNALLPQMSAQVSFVLGEARGVLKVPAAALQAPGAGAPWGEPEGVLLASTDGAVPAGRAERGPEGEARLIEAGSAEAEVSAAGAAAARFASTEPSWVTGADSAPRRQTVLVMTADGPQSRQIEVGLVSRTEAEIVSGLQEGEEIVLGLAAGMPASAQAGGFRPGGGFGGGPGGFRPGGF